MLTILKGWFFSEKIIKPKYFTKNINSYITITNWKDREEISYYKYTYTRPTGFGNYFVYTEKVPFKYKKYIPESKYNVWNSENLVMIDKDEEYSFCIDFPHRPEYIKVLFFLNIPIGIEHENKKYYDSAITYFILPIITVPIIIIIPNICYIIWSLCS
jgi:hypothetical protein